MSDTIGRQNILKLLYIERSKENELKCNAFRHKHYEEGNMHNHAVQVLGKLILIVRGMEAEDGEG